MTSLCAWCKRDGAPAYPGERDPLEDTGTTLGICSQHLMRVRASARPADGIIKRPGPVRTGAPQAPVRGDR